MFERKPNIENNKYRRILEESRLKNDDGTQANKGPLYEPSEYEKKQKKYWAVGNQFWMNDFWAEISAFVVAVIVLWLLFFA